MRTQRVKFDLAKAQRHAASLGQPKTSTTAMLKRLVGPRRIMPDEYHVYGLGTKSDEAASTFQGTLAYKRLNARLCDLRWRLVLEDKMLSSTLLHAFGIKTPAIKAMVGSARVYPDAERCENVASVVRFLESHPAPLFAKPVFGYQSRGVALIERAPPGWPRLRINAEFETDAEALAKAMLEQEGGYMLQENVIQHEAIRALAGDAVSTVRLMLTFDEGRVQLQRAVWKICAGGNEADNFRREGNLLGHIDLESGRLTRVITRNETGIEDVAQHTDTGASFDDFSLPHWQELKDMAMVAAPLFPGIRVQSYDIAITDDGPCLIEVNDLGDFLILQLGQESGIWNDELERLTAKKVDEAERVFGLGELIDRLGDAATPVSDNIAQAS